MLQVKGETECTPQVDLQWMREPNFVWKPASRELPDFFKLMLVQSQKCPDQYHEAGNGELAALQGSISQRDV